MATVCVGTFEDTENGVRSAVWEVSEFVYRVGVTDMDTLCPVPGHRVFVGHDARERAFAYARLCVNPNAPVGSVRL